MRKYIGTTVFIYLFIGWFVYVVCFSETFLNMGNVDSVGVAVLWPLFAIKYLCIGVWMVLSAGFGLLI